MHTARATARHISLCLSLLALLAMGTATHAASAAILCYHRFGPSAADSMTLRTAIFEQQIARLRAEGYQFVALDTLLAGVFDGQPLPEKAIAITVDDGHRTVYSELRPILQREKLPVTLFIYPSAISNAHYAMTWQQLAEMRDLPRVSIQSHTYWHPNFKLEKKRLSPEDYRSFVDKQLQQSRKTLQQKLAVKADLLAWPFGIHDDALEQAASTAGYRYAFTIDGRHARPDDAHQAVPRYLIADAQGVEGLIKRLKTGDRQP